MTKIFISYAIEDKASAEKLAQLLERKSWQVWWDRNIPPGKSFDQVIEQAIEAAACVIVLWSQHSVTSNWVKAEAEEGLSRGILVPALIADVKIPLGFRRIQAADLTNWLKGDPGPEINQLIDSVANLMDKSSAAEQAADSITTATAESSNAAHESRCEQGSESESEQQDQSPLTWKAELVLKEWYTWKLRVHLTNDVHVITVRSPISKGNFIELNGEEVSRQDEIGLFGWTGKHDFLLTDGSIQCPAAIKVDHHWFNDKITRCQLVVNDTVLFNEGY